MQDLVANSAFGFLGRESTGKSALGQFHDFISEYGYTDPSNDYDTFDESPK